MTQAQFFQAVAEANDLIGHSADTSRAELLEVTIILLITYEIVAAFAK